MRSSKRYLTLGAALVALLFVLGACNTIRGAGRDIEKGGKAIENAADHAHQSSNTGSRHVTIHASAGSGGAINPSGALNVPAGTDQLFTFKPNTGYHTADVLVDGHSIGRASGYRFAEVRADHRISVKFALNQDR